MLRITVLSLLVALPALAGELKGVTVPDGITVEGKALKLNGLGLRKKAFFKVYVGALYLENAGADADKIIAADEVRQMEMHMLRDLEKHKITEAVKDGFEKNSKDKMSALNERLTKFSSVIPDVKEGQVLTITYVPGKGTTVKGAGVAEVNVEGKDFADALFQVWLGKNPVDDDLKKGLLGGK